MTWDTHSLGSTLAKTSGFFKSRIWVWPIAALLLLSTLGFFINHSIVRTMKDNLASQLTTLLDVEVAMLRTWLAAQESNSESMANNAKIRDLTRQMIAVTEHTQAQLSEPEKAIVNASQLEPVTAPSTTFFQLSDLRRELSRQLAPSLTSHDYTGFLLTDRQQTVLAASESTLIGVEAPSVLRSSLARVLDGISTVSKPFPSIAPLKDDDGQTRTGVPTMFTMAPIRDENFQVVATLAFRIRPGREFTRILQLGRIGESGETYAFDSKGLMLSNSRFDNDLILLGLLPDQEETRSMLQLLVRDPMGDMTQGFRPSIRRAELPLTLMAENAALENSSVNVDGYRDYRGVTVVGAWTWLEDFNFGVTTESDYSEAFRPLVILQRTFWSLMVLLTITSLAIFAFSVIVSRLQRQAREAAIEAKQLGQYKLQEKLGEGAMGVVYKGRHAMLARPTAIKMLTADNVTEKSIASFEREVQVTSRLNHPNTVAIFDYGRTPEDVFYYAMEYLDGINLQELVDVHGPQPAGRVIHILRQACGSLYEAHSLGLVHRDIKPANIMLNLRGGEADVVKVLDFGLVRATEEIGSGETGLAGTPLYMSPEAIQMPASIDACSDIYSIGAVGYFLLTGRPVFQADSLTALCQLHISESPIPPSKLEIENRSNPIPKDVEKIILSCLEKTRLGRPSSARELAIQLSSCKAADDWDMAQADIWWSQQNHSRPLESPADSSGTSSSTSFSSKSINHSAATVENLGATLDQ